MNKLLSISETPEGFDYPSDFIRAFELGILALEPWWALEGDRLRRRLNGLRDRYPSRGDLVPFATRQDCDDIACFRPGSDAVVIIHDFASPGWEERATYESFVAWLRQAVEDYIEFGG